MPDLSKALGDVYGQAPEPIVAGRQIDDDLAAALSAALVNAPAVSPPTDGSGPFAGALRDLSAAPPSPAPLSTPPVVAAGVVAPDAPAVPAASSPTAPAAQTPLPGPPWRREDDDILPGGSGGRKKAKRGLHLGRR